MVVCYQWVKLHIVMKPKATLLESYAVQGAFMIWVLYFLVVWYERCMGRGMRTDQ